MKLAKPKIINSRAEFTVKIDHSVVCPETVPRNLPKSSLNVSKPHKKSNSPKRPKKVKFNLSFFQIYI